MEEYIDEQAQEIAEERADKEFPVDPDNQVFPYWEWNHNLKNNFKHPYTYIPAPYPKNASGPGLWNPFSQI